MVKWHSMSCAKILHRATLACPFCKYRTFTIANFTLMRGHLKERMVF